MEARRLERKLMCQFSLEVLVAQVLIETVEVLKTGRIQDAFDR